MNSSIKIFKNDLDQDALESFLASSLIAVDCEMMGLNIHRDRLCLVQIAADDKPTLVVQIEKGQKEAPLLKKLLEEISPLKIFHFARTDLNWLKYWLRIEVKAYFCTKLASKLARTYTDKHSLKDLVKELTGKELNKNQQSSDWGRSEINPEQIKYAVSDVTTLIKIYNWLKDILIREGKYDLALQCMQTVALMSNLDALGYSSVFEH